MTDHPISLPPKLWDEWIEDGCDGFLAACEAARWGADQELEACCEYMRDNTSSEVHCVIDAIRAARRPDPPSKSQALKALEQSWTDGYIKTSSADIIRRALELLPE